MHSGNATKLNKFTSTANNIWNSNSHNDQFLTTEDSSDLSAEDTPNLSEDKPAAQPDDSKYANNQHIRDNYLYADAHDRPQYDEMKNWGVGKMYVYYLPSLLRGIRSSRDKPITGVCKGIYTHD